MNQTTILFFYCLLIRVILGTYLQVFIKVGTVIGGFIVTLNIIIF